MQLSINSKHLIYSENKTNQARTNSPFNSSSPFIQRTNMIKSKTMTCTDDSITFSASPKPSVFIKVLPDAPKINLKPEPLKGEIKIPEKSAAETVEKAADKTADIATNTEEVKQTGNVIHVKGENMEVTALDEKLRANSPPSNAHKHDDNAPSSSDDMSSGIDSSPDVSASGDLWTQLKELPYAATHGGHNSDGSQYVFTAGPQIGGFIDNGLQWMSDMVNNVTGYHPSPKLMAFGIFVAALYLLKRRSQ